MLDSQPLQGKTALITGGAARLGAMSARYLHAAGAHVVIHYRNSATRAQELLQSLLELRPASASLVQGDLLEFATLPGLLEEALQATGQLDILLNNASTYYPTPVDEATGEILSAVVTTNDIHDGQVLADVLDGIDGEIEQVSTDGAYDHRHCYDEIAQREAKAVIPPRKDAKIWEHGNLNSPPHNRDENLRYIRKHGRKKWKKDSQYHRRSLAETTMGRHKREFGGVVSSRTFDNQAVELFIQCAALNRMIQIAKPDSYSIES